MKRCVAASMLAAASRTRLLPPSSLAHTSCMRAHAFSPPVCRCIGYHLLVFALNNSMPVTAAHLGGILRAVRPRGAAAAAGRAASELASCDGGKPSGSSQQTEVTCDDSGGDASCSKAGASSSGAGASSSGSGSSSAAGKLPVGAKAAFKPRGGDPAEQSPLHILRAALQVMAMLLLMYLLLDLTAAVVKGKQPMQELQRSIRQIKALFSLMAAPLLMMCIGLALAIAQYGLQLGGARRAPAARPAAAGVPGRRAGGAPGEAGAEAGAAAC